MCFPYAVRWHFWQRSLKTFWHLPNTSEFNKSAWSLIYSIICQIKNKLYKIYVYIKTTVVIILLYK